MEIRDIETVLLSCRVPEEKTWRLGGLPGQLGWKGVKADTIIVKVHTDEGIVGLGEPSPYGGAIPLREAIMRLKPYLIGKDPFDVDLPVPPLRYGRNVNRLVMAGINIA